MLVSMLFKMLRGALRTHNLPASLEKRVFRDDLKISKVTPIYKDGDNNDISNYRPISVLPCFSAILERFMYNRRYKYLKENNILYEKQFGCHNLTENIETLWHN